MFLTVGAIDRCRTLERPTPEIVRRTIIKPPWRVTFERLGQTVPDEELRRAIATALRRDRLRRSARPAGRVLRRLGLRGGS
jgi:hypothetical protein